MIALAWRVVAVAAVLGALVGLFDAFTGHYVQVGRDQRDAELAVEKKEAVSAELVKRDADHKLDIDQSRKVLTDYEKQLADANDSIAAERRRNNAYRMQFDAVCRASATATGIATGAVDADGEGSKTRIDLPDEIARNLSDLAEDADRQIVAKDEKIKALQQWAISHGFADIFAPSPPPDQP